MCSIRDNLTQLNDLDANVVVISCDTRFVHKKWAEEQGFEFPILSDFWPHGDTARAYGSFNETKGVANRMTYVLDADGIVWEVIDSGSLGVARRNGRIRRGTQQAVGPVALRGRPAVNEGAAGVQPCQTILTCGRLVVRPPP